MLSLLTLLLLGCSIGSDRLCRADSTLEVSSKSEQRVLAKFGKRRLYIETRAVFTEYRIGVLDVGRREGLDGILESGESGDDLCGHQYVVGYL